MIESFIRFWFRPRMTFLDILVIVLIGPFLIRNFPFIVWFPVMLSAFIVIDLIGREVFRGTKS